jgi:hypothetical protein
MGEVNYYNIHEYISYKILEYTNMVFIYWDTSNEQIHNLMLNENLLFKKAHTINCLWINQVKCNESELNAISTESRKQRRYAVLKIKETKH